MSARPNAPSPASRDVRVVAQVGEELRPGPVGLARPSRPWPNSRSIGLRRSGVAEHAAGHVPAGGGGVHQRRRRGSSRSRAGHVAGVERGFALAAPPVPTDTISILSVRSTSRRIGRRGGHLEREEGRVVVGGHAAVDEDEALALGLAFGEGDHFGRKEGRRRGAGAHELPQRQVADCSSCEPRPSWLYLANGLLPTGHGESVLDCACTIISNAAQPRAAHGRAAERLVRARPAASRQRLARHSAT